MLHNNTLDYGAGIGNFTLYARKYIKITPAEKNLDCINYMSSIGLNPIRINKDDNTLVKNNTFNSAILDNVLEHVSDVDKVINEVKRLVKIDGVIVIGVPGILGFNLHWDHKTFFDEMALEKLCNKFNLKLTGFMYAPLFKSKFLSRNLRQYCIYAKIINTK